MPERFPLPPRHHDPSTEFVTYAVMENVLRRAAYGYLILVAGILIAFGLLAYDLHQGRADRQRNEARDQRIAYDACVDSNRARQAFRQVIILATQPRPGDDAEARAARAGFRSEALRLVQPSDCGAFLES